MRAYRYCGIAQETLSGQNSSSGSPREDIPRSPEKTSRDDVPRKRPETTSRENVPRRRPEKTSRDDVSRRRSELGMTFLPWSNGCRLKCRFGGRRYADWRTMLCRLAAEVMQIGGRGYVDRRPRLCKSAAEVMQIGGRGYADRRPRLCRSAAEVM